MHPVDHKCYEAAVAMLVIYRLGDVDDDDEPVYCVCCCDAMQC